MKGVKKFFYVVLLIGGFSSCSSYYHISENDVYMQKPTALNLDENEDDITSFNSFKARNEGRIEDEYIDNRLNHVMMRNQFLVFSSFHPYAYYKYDPFHNRFILFPGFGMDPFYDPFYSYYHPSYHYYPYYGYYDPYYNYGFGYYNPYYNYGYTNVNNSSSSNVVYTHRKSMTSGTSRSSYLKSQSVNKSSLATTTKEYSTDGTSRRGANLKVATGKEFINTGTSISKSNMISGSNRRVNTVTNVNRSSINRKFEPSNSARNSGLVNSTRQMAPIQMKSSRGVSSTSNSGYFKPKATTSPRLEGKSTSSKSVSSPSSSGSSSTSRRK